MMRRKTYNVQPIEAGKPQLHSPYCSAAHSMPDLCVRNADDHQTVVRNARTQSARRRKEAHINIISTQYNFFSISLLVPSICIE